MTTPPPSTSPPRSSRRSCTRSRRSAPGTGSPSPRTRCSSR